ncbi:MAG: O-antigen ligase family protein [Acidobacteria bacterium]|nr:O-antigen ligase family protein [Acidobacteriota bacterium]MBI3657432.1 O-antigen ligase family protein [Acidobacteriota bacterium]
MTSTLATQHCLQTVTQLIIKVCLYLLVLLTPFIVGSPFTIAPLFKINSLFIQSAIAMDPFRLTKEVFVQIVILLLAAVYLIKLSLAPVGAAEWDRARQLARRPVGMALALLVLLSAVSIFFSDNKALAWLDVMNVLLYAVLYLIVIQVADKKVIKKLLYLALAAGVINAIHVLLQYYGHDPFYQDLARAKAIGRYTAGGSLDNPNVAGIYFALALVSAIGLVFTAAVPWKRWLLAAGLFALLAGLIYTQTLTAVAGFLAGMMTWAALRFRYEKAARKYLLAGIALLLVAGTILIGVNKGFRGRLASAAQTIQTRNWGDLLSQRNVWWRVSWDMIKSGPLLGHGIGSFNPSYFDYQREFTRRTGIKVALPHPGQLHNEYLQLWLELGIVGLLLFLYALFAHLRLGCNLCLARGPGKKTARRKSQKRKRKCTARSSKI